MPKTVLVLVPHPDDAEFFAGGTIARFVREGARVVIVIATDGRRGTFTLDADTLARLRQEEASRAAGVMGAEGPVFLGHADLELDSLPAGMLRSEFTRAIRLHRPDAVIAEDAFSPYEVHPDHRAVAWAASDALSFSMLPLFCPEHRDEGLEPHFVVEKYFYSEVAGKAGKVIDVTDTIDIKLAALAEHKSQMEFLVEDVRRQANLAGLDLDGLLGGAGADPIDAVSWAMRAQAAEVGQKAGFAYGEMFRYVRFHPMIESLISTQG
jgi:LmbE family N-acetylglucosaminyl deacetylase